MNDVRFELAEQQAKVTSEEPHKRLKEEWSKADDETVRLKQELIECESRISRRDVKIAKFKQRLAKVDKGKQVR